MASCTLANIGSGNGLSPVWCQAITQCWHTVRCCYNAVNFQKNIHKRHTIARPLGRGMGCLLWIQHLIDIMREFMQSFIQYLAILDRIITALDCIANWDLESKLQWNLNTNFLSRKHIWKCRVWNGVHFIQSTCQDTHHVMYTSILADEGAMMLTVLGGEYSRQALVPRQGHGQKWGKSLVNLVQAHTSYQLQHLLEFCETWTHQQLKAWYKESLSNLKYKVHQIPKLKCFLSGLAIPFPNPLEPGVKSRMKM